MSQDYKQIIQREYLNCVKSLNHLLSYRRFHVGLFAWNLYYLQVNGGDVDDAHLPY